MASNVVYFVEDADTGLIKIGTTGNIKQRLLGLGNPGKGVRKNINLLVTTHGTVLREKKFHEKFSQYRVQGEWFNPSPDIIAEIELLKAGISSVMEECDIAQDNWKSHATAEELAALEKHGRMKAHYIRLAGKEQVHMMRIYERVKKRMQRERNKA